MSENNIKNVSSMPKDMGRSSRIVNRIFKYVFRCIYVLALVSMVYWGFASDRYVSEAVVMVQNTDSASSSNSLDLLSMISGTVGNASDQLILTDYLTSLDMLKKLDAKYDLRSHYADREHDIISRMWDRDIEIEWFYGYFKDHVTVKYDDYTGVVRINAQAFTPEMAKNISSFLVDEGEIFMNSMSHAIANEQVSFLEKEVETARQDLQTASDNLLNFQNQKNMASPTIEVENYQKIIADLEAQKSALVIKLQSLPSSIGSDNQIKQSLSKNIAAIDGQIKKVRSILTSDKRTSLNELVDREQILKMDLEFKKDIYSSALTGLVKGKMNAARLIKHVSVVQNPSMPEYAMKPERIYNALVTFFVTLLFLGMLQLLKSIILDHVD